ncbi:PadR family transcriptional regulator [Auritidibacter ignavus]|uniref:PadR family transcriptional regulator n=2 Tax=Micrococcaceae TaxID=1268 RepID=UPI0024491F45|nr:PadR family transcriptional regulator [Auritidibacter ignavus]WGH82818.1 PadR family transcriptional regulator [Auritidibacter ignavus]
MVLGMSIEDVGAQLRRGVVEACVLGLLSKRAMYGWELSQLLVDEGQIIGGIGTLYPVLTRLRKSNYVTTFDQLSDEGRTRRYYELTDAGQAALDAFRQQWAHFVPAVTRHITPDREGNQS